MDTSCISNLASDEVSRRSWFLGVFRFLCIHDLFGLMHQSLHYPHRCSGFLRVIRLCDHLDASVSSELFYLMERFAVSVRIYSKCCTMMFAHDRKSGNVAGAVCHIDHVAELYASIFISNLCIYVDGRPFDNSDALVNLE